MFVLFIYVLIFKKTSDLYVAHICASWSILIKTTLLIAIDRAAHICATTKNALKVK